MIAVLNNRGKALGVKPHSRQSLEASPDESSLPFASLSPSVCSSRLTVCLLGHQLLTIAVAMRHDPSQEKIFDQSDLQSRSCKNNSGRIGRKHFLRDSRCVKGRDGFG